MDGVTFSTGMTMFWFKLSFVNRSKFSGLNKLKLTQGGYVERSACFTL